MGSWIQGQYYVRLCMHLYVCVRVRMYVCLRKSERNVYLVCLGKGTGGVRQGRLQPREGTVGTLGEGKAGDGGKVGQE